MSIICRREKTYLTYVLDFLLTYTVKPIFYYLQRITQVIRIMRHMGWEKKIQGPIIGGCNLSFECKKNQNIVSVLSFSDYYTFIPCKP